MVLDSHAHLDMQEFDQDREEVLHRAKKNGVRQIVTVGIDLNSSLKALQLAKTHQGLFAAVGYHPHHADQITAEGVDRLAALCSQPEVVAWGEIGLDFYRYRAPQQAQEQAFQMQLQAAEDLGLPVIIHDREAHGEVLKAVRRMRRRGGKGVIHCFSGDMALASEFIRLGYDVSIPGTVTYQQARQVRAVAAALPLDSLLLETDAPFLSPVPLRGRRNEPGYITHTARAVARLRQMEVFDLHSAASRNAQRLFNITEHP